MRLFGGTLPEVDVEDIRVAFHAEPGAPVFPVKSLTVPSGIIEHGDGIEVTTTIAVESLESPSWTIPTSIDVTAQLSDALVPEAINVKFDRPLEVGGVEPYPFVRGGFAGIEMVENRALTINDLHVGFQTGGGKEPFLTTKRIAITVDRWALDPDELKIAAIAVDTPVLNLTYDRFGASALTDLDHALRAPTARDVAANARRFAERLAEKQKPAQEPEDEELEDELDPAEIPKAMWAEVSPDGGLVEIAAARGAAPSAPVPAKAAAQAAL